jgi:hypothetical protein
MDETSRQKREHEEYVNALEQLVTARTGAAQAGAGIEP